MDVSELQVLLRKLDGLHLVGQMVGSRFDDSETQDLIENAPADENENPFEICLRSERSEYLTEAIQKLTEKEQLVISLYYNPTTTAFVASRRGPKPAVPEGTTSWDIYEWQWVS